MSIARDHHRFTLADYEQMIDYGILTKNDRVELIRGEIIDKMSIGELHAACMKRLNRLFNSRLAGRVGIGIQDPIRLTDSQPEPDVTLLKLRDDDYATSHPGPSDALLVVEVADTSLDFDRNDKASLYAENGIVEYWILNLFDRTLEVHRRPLSTGQYAEVRVLATSETIDLVCLPGETFGVGELFPPVAS